MKAHIFQDAMSSTTKVFGRKAVNVIFAGGDAKTDGNTVYIPALPATAEVTKGEADVYRGYRSHEAMHVRITDTAGLAPKINAAMQGDRFIAKMVNYIEDIRIENAGVQEYPGMRDDLSAVNVAASKEVAATLEKLSNQAGATPGAIISAASPEVQFGVAMPYYGRKAIGIECGEYEWMIPHIRPEIAAFAKRVADETMALPTGINKKGNLDEAAGMRGSHNAFELAEKALADFRKLCQQVQQPDTGAGRQDGGGGDSESGDSGEHDRTSCNDDAESDDEDSGAEGDSDADEDGDEGEDADGAGDGEESDGGDDADSEEGGDDAGEEEGDDAGDDAGDGDGGNAGGGDDAEESQANGDDAGKQAGGDSQETGSGGSSLSDIASNIKVSDYRDAMNAAAQRINERAGVSERDDSGMAVLPWRQFSNNGVSEIDVTSTAMYRQRDESLWAHNYEDVRASVSSKMAMVRRVLEQELQARFDRRWNSGFSSGKLHNGLLADAVCGRENVYRRRDDGRDIDTLLRLHVDASSSMGWGISSRIGRAAALAVCLCEALEKTGCEIEVTTWMQSTSNLVVPSSVLSANQAILRSYYEDKMARGANGRPELYTSIGIGQIHWFKRRNMRMSSEATKARLGSMLMVSNGGTPLIETLLPAVRDMAKERHGKRILVVMTDGEPNSAIEGSDKSVNLAMENIHDECRRHGVHLIGVGIEFGVKHLFSDNVVVKGPDDYADVMRHIANILKQERTNAFRMAA